MVERLGCGSAVGLPLRHQEAVPPGPGRLACLLDNSAPHPNSGRSHDWKEGGSPPTISLGALSFLLTLLTSLLPCSSPLRSREHHVFNFSGPAAAVKSFQGDSSSFTAVSFLSFSLSLSLSLSLSYLGRFLLC